jgi:hypothetical protein
MRVHNLWPWPKPKATPPTTIPLRVAWLCYACKTVSDRAPLGTCVVCGEQVESLSRKLLILETHRVNSCTALKRLRELVGRKKAGLKNTKIS